jgi:hypothetical protein
MKWANLHCYIVEAEIHGARAQMLDMLIHCGDIAYDLATSNGRTGVGLCKQVRESSLPVAREPPGFNPTLDPINEGGNRFQSLGFQMPLLPLQQGRVPARWGAARWNQVDP